MTYGRTFTYGGLPSTNETVSTINYPWISVYYQMNNLPGWLSVWQSFAQMSYKMYNQNFQQAYYAANLYNDYMWNATATMADVIVNITADVAEQGVIYNDPQYGMN